MPGKGRKHKGQATVNQTEMQLVPARTVASASSEAAKDSAVIFHHVEQKGKREEQALVPLQCNMLNIFSDHNIESQEILEDDLGIMFNGYDINAIKDVLPKQRQLIEQHSYDEFPRQGDFLLKGRQESLVFIEEKQFQEKTNQICDKLEFMAKAWKEQKFETQLTQLLKDGDKQNEKNLENHHKILKEFRKKEFEMKLVSVAKQLKIFPGQIDNFREQLLDLLQKKSLSQSIGCDLYAIEIALDEKITLKFCQDKYKKFLPLLIKQKEEGSEDKVWIYGHKKHLKLHLINERGFEILKSQRENDLLDVLSQTSILIYKQRKTPSGEISASMSGVFLVVKKADVIKEIKLTQRYYKDLLFSETLVPLEDKKLTPFMLEDIESCYGSAEVLETIETLTELTPALYQNKTIFGTETQPACLEKADWLTPIYHDIVSKNGHVTSVSERFFEEIIVELAKALPSQEDLDSAHFFALIEKLEKTLQWLQHHWQKEGQEGASTFPALASEEEVDVSQLTDEEEMDLGSEEKPDIPQVAESEDEEEPIFSFESDFADQKMLLALLKEAESCSAIFPNLENKIKEPKEVNGGNFFVLLKELQVFINSISSQVSQILKTVEQEKKSVAADDFERLYKLSEKARILGVTKNLELQLQILIKKYPQFETEVKLERENSSPGQYLAKLKTQFIFLVKFKKNYIQLSEKIKTIEIQIKNSTTPGSGDVLVDLKRLEARLFQQVNFIKENLYTEMHFSGTDFFLEALLALERITNDINELPLIDEMCLKTIVATKKELAVLQATERESFLVSKNKFIDKSNSEILSKINTFREAIECLVENLIQHKNSPQSKEFFEGKACLEVFLTDWKKTKLYKKISQMSETDRTRKFSSSSCSFAESNFLDYKKRLKKSNQQIAKQIAMHAEEVILLDTYFPEIIKTYQSQMLTAPALKEKLCAFAQKISQHQSRLISILRGIFGQIGCVHIREINIQEEEIITEINLWRLSRAQHEMLQNALLQKAENFLTPLETLESKVKEESTTQQPLYYVGSVSDLMKLAQSITFLSSLQQYYLSGSQKGLDIMKMNQQRLRALKDRQAENLSTIGDTSADLGNVGRLIQVPQKKGRVSLKMFDAKPVEVPLKELAAKKTEILSLIDIPTEIDKMKHLIQVREKEVQSFEEGVKLYISKQKIDAQLGLQAKINMVLALDELTRSTYAELQTTIHNLYCLNQEIDLIVKQQNFYAKQIEMSNFCSDASNITHLLVTAQETLQTELQDLQEQKKILLVGDVTQDISAPGTLATLIFELKSELDRLVGKQRVDEHYWNLQKICFSFKPLLEKEAKTEKEEQLIFKDDATQQLFESHLKSLKEALMQMKIRAAFANEHLKEIEFSILSDKALTPKKYLIGLLRNIENLERMIKRFECQKVVDPAHFAKQVSVRSTVRKPDPLAMALWSQHHEEARKQFLAAHTAALQARNFAQDAEAFFDTRETEALLFIDNHLKALHHQKEALILKTKQHHRNLKERHFRAYATFVEAECNNRLLLQYPLLLEKRANHDSTRQQSKSKTITEVLERVIRTQVTRSN